MPHANNRGVRLYWEEHGSGPPVLLIMGLSFTLEMWFRLLPYLQSTYRVVLFDNRGMGRSDVPPGPYTVAQMASDAVAVMEAAEMPTAHVVGASMGGMIAQELTLRYPSRVLSLALGCTSYSGLFAKWPNFKRAPTVTVWLRMTQPERDRAMRRMLYHDETPEAFINEDVQIQSQCICPTKGILNQLAAVLMWSSFRRLPRIRVPALIAHGEDDHLIPAINGQRLALRIPLARFELIAKAGHILMTDQPDLTARYLLQFLGEVSAPGAA